jgi:hypothetical protein
MAAIALVPMMAWAGMNAITDTELQDVQAQAGLTVTMALDQSMGTITWTDDGNDFVIGSATMPTVSLTGVTIDVLAGGLQIATGAAPIMTGTFQATITCNGSWGTFTVNGLSMSVGTVLISGH